MADSCAPTAKSVIEREMDSGQRVSHSCHVEVVTLRKQHPQRPQLNQNKSEIARRALMRVLFNVLIRKTMRLTLYLWLLAAGIHWS